MAIFSYDCKYNYLSCHGINSNYVDPSAFPYTFCMTNSLTHLRAVQTNEMDFPVGIKSLYLH
eukprot:scaffold408162_cov22-Prasinocladus_malaysianus.AAC.1